MNITITDLAAEKLNALVAERGPDDLGLRLFAQGGGGGCACSGGMRFGMAFDSPEATDARVAVGTLEFIVDPASADALEGASLDYIDDVMSQGFSITAPNAQSGGQGGGCGCGGH